MKDISIDEVLFGKKDAEISRGIKTNVVKVFTKCPICGCKSFVVVGGNINHFFCGTAIKMTTETKDGKMTTTGTMVNKCKYNMFNFFREHNYNPSMHYDSQYLENLDIEITGCCMYHNYDIPIQTESQHIKIYEKEQRVCAFCAKQNQLCNGLPNNKQFFGCIFLYSIKRMSLYKTGSFF